MKASTVYCTVTLQAPSSKLVRNVTVYLSLFVTSRNDAERPHLPENLYLCVCVCVLWGHTWKYTAPTRGPRLSTCRHCWFR